MLSSQLKIARDIKDLLWMVLEMRKNMPKHRAFGIADRMQETIDKMFSCVSYAIRRRVLSLRSTDWSKYVYVRGRHKSLRLRPRYRIRNKQKQRLYEYGY